MRSFPHAALKAYELPGLVVVLVLARVRLLETDTTKIAASCRIFLWASPKFEILAKTFSGIRRLCVGHEEALLDEPEPPRIIARA